MAGVARRRCRRRDPRVAKARRSTTASQRVRIDPVDEGRGVGFSWWDRDDPSSASYVQLDIVELPGGGSQLHITERFVVRARRASSTVGSTGVSWQVRFVSLWFMAVQSSVTGVTRHARLASGTLDTLFGALADPTRRCWSNDC